MKKTIVGVLMMITLIFYGAPAEASTTVSYDQQITEIKRQLYIIQVALLTYQLQQLNQLAATQAFTLAAGTVTQTPVSNNILSIIVDREVVVRPVVASLEIALEMCRESLAQVSETSLQECVYNDELIYTTVLSD